MTHTGAGFLTAWMACFSPKLYVPKKLEAGISGYLSLIAIALFFSAGVGLNNTSLMHLPLSTAQMIKSTHPAVLAVCLYFIEEARYSKEKILAIAGIVFGVGLAVFGNQSATPIGVLLSLGSVLAGALHTAYLSLNLGPKVKLNGLDVLYYSNPLVIVFLFPAFIITSEYNVIADFVNTEGTGRTLLYLLIGCVFAVTYNLTVLFFIKALSALYMSVTGTVKVVVIIVLSIVFFDEHVSVLNAVGIFVALAAFGYNSYLTYVEKLGPKPKPAAATPTNSETAPLNQDNAKSDS